MPTYRIEEKQNSKDPALFLKTLLDTELKDAKVDFAIISVGANDVTELDTDAHDFATLTNLACEQSKDIAFLADHASKRFKIDIFIVERPPRIDDVNEPKNMRSTLTGSANGLYMSLITPMERVHLITLHSLSNYAGKARRDCFEQDGIHVNGKGSSNLS